MKRVPAKAAKRRATPRSRKKSSRSSYNGKLARYAALSLLAAALVLAVYNYRHGFLYWLGFKTNKRIEALTKEQRNIEKLRMYEILSRHRDKVFGIDVSHYQGSINWQVLKANNAEFPLHFIFVRATAGSNSADTRFRENWAAAKKHGYLRGAYHYYRPNENSLKQAEHFIKRVKLAKGDLPPVLDIEKIPDEQSIDSLKSGLKRWLQKVEGHYHMKPIIYSGESFYTDFLKKEFEGYDLWIANYSFFEEEIRKEWLFWQFTDKAELPGLSGHVDVNIYNGTIDELRALVK